MAHCGLCFRDNDTEILILNTSALGDFYIFVAKPPFVLARASSQPRLPEVLQDVSFNHF